YKGKGQPSWYQFTGNLFQDRLAEIYFLSMDRKDLERVPIRGWLAFLDGKDADYPVQALQKDLEHVRSTMKAIEADTTTADTRLADYLQELNPAATMALTNLTTGAYLAGNIWSLHSRFRYFDPVRRRAGLPDDVGALVEKLEADAATLTLVNVDPVEARNVIVQAGAYGEHRFESAEMGGKTTAVGGPLLTVRLEPGSGARIRFRMARYVHPPTLSHPWDRGWFGHNRPGSATQAAAQ
ncbi:MAG TPA: hypothetical protein VES20_01050, partial [Bryobacteraceae bacterium]|nr:hypothetical protein [Bryobacteraceae bacterium]